MKKLTFAILIYFLLTTILTAQFDEQAFFSRANSIYHNLNSKDVKNFALSITSNYFEITTKGFLDSEEYSPIEFVWQSPGKMYFIKRAIPVEIDTFAQKGINNLQNDMQQGLKGIFIDWQRFLGGNILDDLPKDYIISSVGDTVHIEFESTENNVPVKMKFFFGINALCFKIETHYETIDQKMITYPEYVLIDKKWLCTSWTVKILQAGEITSGFTAAITSKPINKNWFPVHALITVQTKKKLNETFRRIYKFRNLRINRDIKVVGS